MELKLPRGELSSEREPREKMRADKMVESAFCRDYAGFTYLPCRVTRAEQQPMEELELRSRQR